jgi:chromosome segregation ATPase
MSEKVLQEFSAKIVKAKNLYENTKQQCDSLRREAGRLQKEYDMLVAQRKAAEDSEESLKNQYLQIKKENEQEGDRCSKELSELNGLRALKKKLKREKDIYESELLKNNLTLEELIKERQALENTARTLNERLENITVEKNALQGEFQQTNNAIEEYTVRIRELRG